MYEKQDLKENLGTGNATRAGSRLAWVLPGSESWARKVLSFHMCKWR